jgi:hypothetical protein
MKNLLFSVVILTIMLDPFSTAYPNDDGSAGLAGFGVIAGGLTVIFSGIYDISSAHKSAEKYNSSVTGIIPIQKTIQVYPKVPVFARSSFSRDALVKNNDRLTVYTFQMSKARKSPGTATWWSLGSTLIPTAAGYVMMNAGSGHNNSTLLTTGLIMVTGGWILGPSAGHWYAEQHSRGWTSAFVRAVAFGVGLISVIVIGEGLE